MKSWFAIATLSAAALPAAELPSRSMRVKAVQAIARMAPAAATSADPAPPAARSGTILMDPFVVIDDVRRPELERAVERETQKVRDAQFSIVKGGALLKKDMGKTRIELGTWGAASGLNILRISW